MTVIFDSMCVQMKQTFARNMYRFCMFIQPFTFTIILAEMYKNSSQNNFTAYVILGSGLMSLWGCICFSSAGDINRERYNQTLSLIFVSPSDFRYILLGKIIGNTILSVTSFVLTILYASIVYRMPVSIRNLPLFVLSFLLTVVCFIVISLFVAYLLTLSRRTQLFMNCIDIPLTLICGFAFPVELLPQWMQHIAFALPLTWAVKLMRQSVLGNYIDFKKNLFALFITTMLFVLLSASSYKIIKQQIKINGSLEMV